MTPYYQDALTTILAGDCVAMMGELPPDSVDAIVTDPPYHLVETTKRFANHAAERVLTGAPGVFVRHAKGFMGQTWDGGDVAFRPETWAAALRVLKPGGHLVAFGGSRTWHRMACAVEDAGFEIRDCLAWMYGSGFPKSLDVSKALDKMAGAERPRTVVPQKRSKLHGDRLWMNDPEHRFQSNTPATPAPQEWQGWGTALKPAYEPIVLARKPLAEASVAANVTRYGTGAINVDACRLEAGAGGARDGEASADARYAESGATNFAMRPGPRGGAANGRWPANVLLDEEAAALLDEQSGVLQSGFMGTQHTRHSDGGYHGNFPQGNITRDYYGDKGGASRFFYTAKTSKSERQGVTHPTVKPVSLMRWLCRLVTPPGGVVLDCFAGSGTTRLAALAEGFRCVLIEQNPEYLEQLASRAAQPGLPLEVA